ncbi:RNase A-like domain-containing protein [Luteimonas sp. MJ246]|uniref:RNase A-like domain-containing protein n=1 Tax=Luteimonas sp. MJ174 TaxID=3129237 RepID=UPI0031BA27AD
MDAAQALSPATRWSLPPLAPLQQSSGRAAMAAAADPDSDLVAHLQALADDGDIEGFLGQVRDAISLAGGDRTFGEHLDPLLGRIRDALGELDVSGLPRAGRDAVEATTRDLDAHLATDGVDSPDVPDGPDAPGEVPGGGLQAHEDAGGHLIERHVGKSEEWLVDRVRRDNISAASSFRDIGEAGHFVAATLSEHQGRIDAWVDGKGGNRLVVDASFDASTGISVKRGDSQAEDVFSVRLVLERSDRLDTGYRIVTGYPSTP